MTAALGWLFLLTIGKELVEVVEAARNDAELVNAMAENPMLLVSLLLLMAIVAVFMVAFIFPLIGWQRRPRQHCGVVGLCHLRQRGRLAAVS